MLVGVTDFLIPNGTFIAELIAFILVVVAVAHYVVPPVNKALDERQATIRSGLAAAEEGRQLLERGEAERARLVEEARQQARGIVEQASRLADEARSEILAKGEEERDRMMTRARAELAREASEIAEEARRHLVELVMAAAERVVGAELDESRQRSLIEETVRELEQGEQGAASPAEHGAS